MLTKKLITSKQVAQLSGMLAQATPTDLDSTTAQGWIEKPHALREVVLRALMALEPKDGERKFVVAHYFSYSNLEVKFFRLGKNFQEWFYSLEEEVVSIFNLPCPIFDLTKSSLDAPILKALGGVKTVKKYPSTLRGIYELLLKHSRGEKTDLLTNGDSNVFYVCSKNNELFTMTIWLPDSDRGWRVAANDIDAPFGWRSGSRVFAVPVF